MPHCVVPIFIYDRARAGLGERRVVRTSAILIVSFKDRLAALLLILQVMENLRRPLSSTRWNPSVIRHIESVKTP